MLVKQFKFKRNHDKGDFRWGSGIPRSNAPVSMRVTAVGRTLSDVREFAALVRWCERTVNWNSCRKCTRPVGRNEC